MASVYSSTPANHEDTSMGDKYAHLLPYIPWRHTLIDGTPIIIDFVRTDHEVTCIHDLLNFCIDEGISWPFAERLTRQQFRAYFLSHTALLVRAPSSSSPSSLSPAQGAQPTHANALNPPDSTSAPPNTTPNTSSTTAIVAAFYCKPNYPGRCAHFCNGGFMTHPLWRRRGIARKMATAFVRIARDLGFKASLFNLVFAANTASVRLWDDFPGFRRLATLPDVAHLRTGLSDGYQYFYDLEAEGEGGSLVEDGADGQSQSVGSQVGALAPYVITAIAFFLLGRRTVTKP